MSDDTDDERDEATHEIGCGECGACSSQWVGDEDCPLREGHACPFCGEGLVTRMEDRFPDDGNGVGVHTVAASSIPSSVALAVDRSRSSPENALTPPTPEQPAVTGEPERHTADCVYGGRPHAGFCTIEQQERIWNDGISQTASRASRPAVESEGSASEESPSWVPVEFRGMTLYVRRAFLDGVEGDSPVAPPEHITDGELNTLDGANSYAHVYRDGGILRYWKKIGEATDLKPLTPVSRTLGATDAPRDDSTDVDPTIPKAWTENVLRMMTKSELIDELARVSTDLSSTRTALQRVREALEVKPFAEWHDDIGNVLWWQYEVNSPPHVGRPWETDWPFEAEDESTLWWTPIEVIARAVMQHVATLTSSETDQ